MCNANYSNDFEAAASIFEGLIAPPPDRRNIRRIARVIVEILGVLRDMPLLEWGCNEVSEHLDEMVELCRAIELEQESVPATWTEQRGFSRGSYITEYPIYAALDDLSKRSVCSMDRLVLAAHVILSIYLGRPARLGNEAAKPIPETNILSACREIRLLPEKYLQKFSDVSFERQVVYEALEKFVAENPQNIPPTMLGRFRNIRRVIGLSMGLERPQKRTRGPNGPKTYIDVTWRKDVGDVDPDNGLRSDSVLTIPALSHEDETTLYEAVQEGLSASDVVGTNTIRSLSSRYSSKKGLSPIHGLHQQRAVANQIKRQSQLLPGRWEQLSELDCTEFIGLITQEVTSVTLALLLSFITGRPLTQIARTKLYYQDKDIPRSHPESHISLCAESRTWISKPPLPERKRSMLANWQQNLAPITENLLLPIPDMVLGLLNQYIGSSSRYWVGNLFKKDDQHDLITQAKEGLRDGISRKDTRLTVKRVQRHLFNLLVSRGGDVADAVLITGNEPPQGQATSLYYYHASVSHLENVYLNAVARMPGLQRRNPESIRQVTINDEAVGSPFCPRLERLPFLVRDLKTELERLRAMSPSKKALIDHHNTYTAYTALFLAFATGYRSVKFPLSRESDIDERSGFLIIADKDGDDMSHSRLVPMVPGLMEHLRFYRNHRGRLVRRLWAFHKQPAPEHFMFFLSRKNLEVSPLTPKTLNVHVQWAYDIPLNANRHFLRSELRARGIPGEQVDVFMGHWTQGQEPHGKFSSFSYKEYRSCIVPVLENIVTDMGWKPEAGLS